MKLQKIVVSFLMIVSLCSAMPLSAMERAKKNMRYILGKPRYTFYIFDAIDRGRIDSVKYWLDQGVDIETRQPIGRDTPLIKAARSGNAAIVKLLLDRGADVAVVNERGEGPLTVACQFSFSSAEPELLVKLLLDKGPDIEARGEYGNTPLMLVASSGFLSLVQEFINRGAHLESVNKDGETALTLAARAGRLDVVKALLDKGANIEVRDKSGDTPLMQAITRLEMVQLLSDRGADIDVVNNTGLTPLMMATRINEWAIVSFLLNKGARCVHALAQVIFDKAMNAPEALDAIRSLVARGFKFDFDQQDSKGETLLMRSIAQGKVARVSFLIEHGANPYLQDKAGFDAFDYAQQDQGVIGILKRTAHVPGLEKMIVRAGATRAEKAIRRLRKVTGHIDPQQRESVKEANILVDVLRTPTPTDAHYNQFKEKIENTFGQSSKYERKGQALRDDPVVKECAVKEQAAYEQGNYVFYRSEPGRYRVYEYFLQELYRLVRLFGEKNPIIFTRFFKDAAQQQTINEYIDTKPWRAHKLGASQNVLLSANIPLFGNVNNAGSSTWYYFLNNYEATGKVELQEMFERIVDRYGFDKKYINDLLSLHEGMLEKASSLQQIIIPKKIVDKVVMFADHGYCFPWPKMVDQSCWDPNAVSVDHDGNERLGRHTCIAPIIDKYRAGEIEIDDNMQVRILMNAVYGLNPTSGIEFNLYTRLPKERIEYFKKQVTEITDKMFGEWLKKQLQSKEVPAEIADEPLGDVLKYLGKGRKEKVKAKL
ncbi:MAG TPA: ankyrin repeat domain-containing protein [Candidatus Babeliales bacterium]|nr:ankyrin repeat domain-containing protein [Candidatus Babeliales bacterium]